jgi:hypothetical protein
LPSMTLKPNVKIGNIILRKMELEEVKEENDN